ncbi:MAG: hypothetical protein M1839_006354 [Geoglossum umbratile]|nr:MAG: hypothetical protein M1839_006354 [Geoglossum umbratile]
MDEVSETDWAAPINFDLSWGAVGVYRERETGPGHWLSSLEIMRNADLRHQQLHEYESVFWLGLLALMACSDAGVKELRDLTDPRQSLWSVSKSKVSLLMSAGIEDHDWQEQMGGPDGGQKSDWNCERQACLKHIGLHFPQNIGSREYRHSNPW